MKPVIGLVPLFDTKKDSYWMLPGYMEGIQQAGGIPIILPLTSNLEDLKTLVSICDGFVFTGGNDIDPKNYQEKASIYLGEIIEARDQMELELMQLVLKQDKPLLGICRGIQLLNVAMGGTLYQDLPSQYSSTINHRQQPPYDRPSHEISLLQNTPLHHLLKQDKIAVNSCHHQAIKDLGKSLEIMAKSDDGIVEAVYIPEKHFVWAVQWHPEFSYLVNQESRDIFKAFVLSCMK